MKIEITKPEINIQVGQIYEPHYAEAPFITCYQVYYYIINSWDEKFTVLILYIDKNNRLINEDLLDYEKTILIEELKRGGFRIIDKTIDEIIKPDPSYKIKEGMKFKHDTKDHYAVILKICDEDIEYQDIYDYHIDRDIVSVDVFNNIIKDYHPTNDIINITF